MLSFGFGVYDPIGSKIIPPCLKLGVGNADLTPYDLRRLSYYNTVNSAKSCCRITLGYDFKTQGRMIYVLDHCAFIFVSLLLDDYDHVQRGINL